MWDQHFYYWAFYSRARCFIFVGHNSIRTPSTPTHTHGVSLGRKPAVQKSMPPLYNSRPQRTEANWFINPSLCVFFVGGGLLQVIREEARVICKCPASGALALPNRLPSSSFVIKYPGAEPLFGGSRRSSCMLMRLRLDDWTCAKIDSDRPCLGCDGYINSISIRSSQTLLYVRSANFFIHTFIHPLALWVSVCVSTHLLSALFFFFYPSKVQLRAFSGHCSSSLCANFRSNKFRWRIGESWEWPSDSSWAKF